MTRMNWRRLGWEKRVAWNGAESRHVRKGAGKRDSLGEIREELERAEREREIRRQALFPAKQPRYRRPRKTHKIRRMGKPA